MKYLFASAITLCFSTALFAAPNYKLTWYQDQAADVAEKIAGLKSKVENCDQALPGKSATNCKVNGRWALGVSLDDIATNKAELKKQEVELKRLQGLIATEEFKGQNPSVSVGDAKLEARYLLMDNRTLQNELDRVHQTMKSAYDALDKTLLGQYTKYVVETAVSDQNPNFCSSVNRCSGVAGTKTKVDAMSKQIKTFEQWKKGVDQKLAQPQPVNGVE